MLKNGDRKITRVLTPILVAGLILSSITLAFIVESLSNIASLQGILSPFSLQKGQQATGYLEVGVRLLTPPDYDRARKEEPIAQLRATVTGVSPSNYNETFYTDSNGVFGAYVPSGEYTVECQDTRFMLSVNINVTYNKKTSLRITMTKLSEQIPFYELYDRDSSGFLSEWEQFFAVIPRSALVGRQVNELTIETSRTHSQIEEITARVLVTDPRGDYVWLSLRPTEGFSVQNISSFHFIKYHPSYEVQVNAL